MPQEEIKKATSCSHMPEGQEGWCLECVQQAVDLLHACAAKLTGGERGLPGVWLVMLRCGAYENESTACVPIYYISEDREAEPDPEKLLKEFCEDFSRALSEHKLTWEPEAPCQCCGRGGGGGRKASDLLDELFLGSADKNHAISMAVDESMQRWTFDGFGIFDASRIVWLANVDCYMRMTEGDEYEAEDLEYYATASSVERPNPLPEEEE